MRHLKQSTAYNLTVLMVDSADHVTGKTGLTLTIKASKAGGTFGAITPTVTELEAGWYKLELTTSHTDTLGDLDLHITASGADASDIAIQVYANSYDTLATPTNITAGTITTVTNLTNLPTMPANWMTASGLATDAVTEIQNGLALEATLTAIKGAGWTTETLAAIDVLIDAIKAKTDNLPASPAAVGDAMTLSAAYDAAKTAATQTSVDTVDTVVDAIKAKTDNLPASPAAVGSAMTLTAAYDKAKDDVLTPLAVVDGIADAIKAKTDNLPASPAATGDAMTLTSAYDNAKADVLTPLATVDGIVDAIKAKTDNLPASPAAVGSAMTLTAAYDNSKADVLTPLAVVDGIVDSIKATVDTNLDMAISDIVFSPTINVTAALSRTEAASVASGKMEITPYYSWTQSFTSTSTQNLGAATKLWLAIKESDVADANGLIFIEKTDGLTVVNRNTYATIAHGTISVTGSAGDWTITVALNKIATALLESYDGKEFPASIKALVGTTAMPIWDGTCRITRGIVRAYA